MWLPTFLLFIIIFSVSNGDIVDTIKKEANKTEHVENKLNNTSRFEDITKESPWFEETTLTTESTTDSQRFTDSTTASPWFEDSTTDFPWFEDSTTDSPWFTDSTTDSPWFTDSTTASPWFTDSTTDSPWFTDSTTDSPWFTDSTTASPWFTDSTTDLPWFTDSTTASPWFEETTFTTDRDTTPITSTSTTTTALPNHIMYFLFNSKVRAHILTSSDTNIPIDPEVGTVVLVHDQDGFMFDRFTSSLLRAFENSHNFNIFLMDWANIDYRRASEDLAKLLEVVRINKETPTNRDLHLIGFGTGAHLVGQTGNILRNVSQVARITGLSPTLMEGFNRTDILNQLDAAYVEVIHTNADKDGGIGIIGEIGHTDFYPNGGARQPGCWSHRCSHERSFELFEVSLMYNHLIGDRCIDMSQMHDNNCSGFRLHMGGAEYLKVPMLPGVYRLNTEPVFPFNLTT